MCFGGGGPKPDNRAADLERERQWRINRSVGKINKMFGDPSREEMYTGHRANVYNYNLDKLNEEMQRANRDLGFQLSRTGQKGGTQGIEARRQLQQNYDDSVLDIGRFADQAANQFRTSDEDARLALIRQAQSGMGATAAAESASNALALNASQAKAYNDLANLGDLFRNVAVMNAYRVQQPQQQPGRQRTSRYGDEDQYQTMFNTGSYSGQTSRIGS